MRSKKHLAIPITRRNKTETIRSFNETSLPRVSRTSVTFHTVTNADSQLSIAWNVPLRHRNCSLSNSAQSEINYSSLVVGVNRFLPSSRGETSSEGNSPVQLGVRNNPVQWWPSKTVPQECAAYQFPAAERRRRFYRRHGWTLQRVLRDYTGRSRGIARPRAFSASISFPEPVPHKLAHWGRYIFTRATWQDAKNGPFDREERESAEIKGGNE